MENFTMWLFNFLETFFKNVWNLIKQFFIGLYKFFIVYPIKYFNMFKENSKNFNFLEWTFSIFFLILFLILIFMIFYVIYIYLRRYFKFSKTEYEKLDLLNQINVLKRKTNYNYNLETKETNDINDNYKINSKNKTEILENRFPRLSLIDEKYKYSNLPIHMKDDDKVSLSELVTRVRHFAASKYKLYYNEKVISEFIAGMATSKIMILEGISGTGKTSLPYVFGKFLLNDSSIISVQPSWRDRFEMMGYLNEFTKRFNETEFLTSIYEASYRGDIKIIVLDEMNIARVEYYFADFLSLLELPNEDEWVLDLVPEQISSDPHKFIDGKIKIPNNVWFVGTANKDDSTFQITDKVYDRASSIEMNERAEEFNYKDVDGINISYDYIIELFKEAKEEYKVGDILLEKINEIDKFITKNFQITFGNRILNQLKNFIPVYIACGRNELEGLDFIISRKIIRKFETLNLPFLKRELESLLEQFDTIFGKDKLVESKKMVLKYINQI